MPTSILPELRLYYQGSHGWFREARYVRVALAWDGGDSIIFIGVEKAKVTWSLGMKETTQFYGLRSLLSVHRVR